MGTLFAGVVGLDRLAAWMDGQGGRLNDIVGAEQQ
jgi:hypothetical protein